MARRVRTIQEYIDIYRETVRSEAGDITDFSAGSIHDILSGAFAITLNEVAELVINEFRKTYFDTAQGADLEGLAVDHFGSNFARPVATAATVQLRFYRPNNNGGAVTINSGTVVSTEPDANGETISFETTAIGNLAATTPSNLAAGARDPSLEVEVSARATTTGASTNAAQHALVVLETALTDSSIQVINDTMAAGGNDAQSDSDYRETIRGLIQGLAGATKKAIEGKLLAIPEIEHVNLIEENILVTPNSGGASFRYPLPIAYLADINGNLSSSLMTKAQAEIDSVRACGVAVQIRAASVIQLDWTARITLLPDGPNFSELNSDPTRIINSMREYVDNTLRIGESFVRSVAEQYILNIWGAGGTNDINSFTTIVPTGDVAAGTEEKIILRDGRIT